MGAGLMHLTAVTRGVGLSCHCKPVLACIPASVSEMHRCAAAPQDEDLRQAAAMLQRGLSAPTLAEEEAAWTAVIDAYGSSTAPWADDVVGRALGNRGNARSRQVGPVHTRVTSGVHLHIAAMQPFSTPLHHQWDTPPTVFITHAATDIAAAAAAAAPAAAAHPGASVCCPG
jgi:hypothetical protein